MNKPKVVTIYEEYVAITENLVQAICLGQMVYWQDRVRDFEKFVDNENVARIGEGKEVLKIDGWIYKDAGQLTEECMLGKSEDVTRKALQWLVDHKFLLRRNNPEYKWDKRYQYVVNIEFLETEIIKRGYSNIPNFSFCVFEGLKTRVRDPENAGALSEITTDIKKIYKKKKSKTPEVFTEETRHILSGKVTALEMTKMAEEFKVDPYSVRKQWDALVDKCIRDGVGYVSWLAALRTWVRKGIEWGTIQKTMEAQIEEMYGSS